MLNAIAEAQVLGTQISSEWARLPKNGERLEGLSRSTVNALVLPTKENGFKPPVKSAVLKSNRHATKGIRLISISSLRDYIAKHAEQHA